MINMENEKEDKSHFFIFFGVLFDPKSEEISHIDE